jgi:RNA polymerase sporulation-specific sigma factor
MVTVNKNYIGLTDEKLAEKVHGGDLYAQDILIEKYKALVKKIARSKYYIKGADIEDIIQEGNIGLFKAIRDYKGDKQAKFYSFACLCIERQIITAIKMADRQKHQFLNESLSIDCNSVSADDDREYIDKMEDTYLLSPEEVVIGDEDYRVMLEKISVILSEFELKVLMMHLEGKTYTEIAKIMGKEDKSIDNALQRIKKKIEKIVKEKDK